MNSLVCLLFKHQGVLQGKEFLRKNALSRLQKSVLLWKVAKCVESCHRRGVAHRDIKLKNTVIDSQGTIRLVDFGFSRFFFDLKKKINSDFCGTIQYMAPELLNKQHYNRRDLLVFAFLSLLIQSVSDRYLGTGGFVFFHSFRQVPLF